MKRFGLRRLGGKRGFTLIELLIVMVILAILAGIVIISVGGVIGRGQATAYDGAKEQVELGVTDYIARTFGDFPTLNGNVSGLLDNDGVALPGGPWYIVDMCSLTLSAGGVLKEVPVSACNTSIADRGGVVTVTGAELHNCASSVYSCNCSATAHYTWLLDSASGDVFSLCTGTADCDKEVEDGFQGVYP